MSRARVRLPRRPVGPAGSGLRGTAIRGARGTGPAVALGFAVGLLHALVACGGPDPSGDDGPTGIAGSTSVGDGGGGAGGSGGSAPGGTGGGGAGTGAGGGGASGGQGGGAGTGGTVGDPGHVGPAPTALRTGDRGTVVHVTDGDTLDVAVGHPGASRTFRIRMKGLSAPECHKEGHSGGGQGCAHDDEYYGLAAYGELRAIVAGGTVTIACDPADEPCETDAWDRVLAYVEVDGVDASTEMARRGAGFSFTRYASSRRAEICRAEDEARLAGRGLWALGTIEEILAVMNDNTRSWHDDRDRLCAEALRGSP